MKKVATITFHAPYNYGANLQAYALQEYVKKLCNGDVEYRIINLRTDIQKNMYKNSFEKNGVKNKIKKALCFREKKALMKKKELFESFINEKLNLTEEFKSSEQINNANLQYDYYISGSDQLWNTFLKDFEWAYFLEFVNSGKKISYSASFGAKFRDESGEVVEREKKDLADYDMISVREISGANRVQELIGTKPDIHIDPTMLLTREDWEKIIPSKPILNGDYILLYYIKSDEEVFKIAKEVSQKLHMPVVVTKKGSKKEMLYGFKKKYDVGPIEFLNLVKNAKLVLSSSFHGTVFSALLNRPFFAVKGAKDARINNLLSTIKLEDRTIELGNVSEKCSKAFEISFDNIEELLEDERKKSEQYLKKALDIV